MWPGSSILLTFILCDCIILERTIKLNFLFTAKSKQRMKWKDKKKKKNPCGACCVNDYSRETTKDLIMHKKIPMANSYMA